MTKLRAIKEVFVLHRKQSDVSMQFGMHRNTLGSLLVVFESQAPPELKEKLQQGAHMNAEEIRTVWVFLANKSRRPKGNKRMATVAEQELILHIQDILKVWAKRVYTHMKRKSLLSEDVIGLARVITPSRIRWVMKRWWCRVQKVRVYNRTHKALYDYASISAFEYMHFDTKVLADQKSLPEHVYRSLKGNRDIPIYEWNIIDAKTRTRFIGYSRGHTSTFWLQFLVYVLSHLRYCGIVLPIHIWVDNGAEFFSWCREKKQAWNDLLGTLHASVDSYNPHWDVRKNLIERSHRSDDEELLIPYWDDMTTQARFLHHTKAYLAYWNTTRPHSGIGMDGMTPKEKLISLNLDIWKIGIDRILDFPTLILDETFQILQEHLHYFQWQLKLWKTNKTLFMTDPKIRIDFDTMYPHLRDYAQNVFAYYHRNSDVMYVMLSYKSFFFCFFEGPVIYF